MSDLQTTKPATSAQKALIQFRARQALMEPDELVDAIQGITGKRFHEMTTTDASNVIDKLGALRPGQYRKGMFV